jgi:hypothetical protein
MYTIAVIAEKGGVGKTTIAIALAVGAGLEGKRAAVIDTDPQATASKWTDRREHEFPWLWLPMPLAWGQLSNTLRPRELNFWSLIPPLMQELMPQKPHAKPT